MSLILFFIIYVLVTFPTTPFNIFYPLLLKLRWLFMLSFWLETRGRFWFCIWLYCGYDCCYYVLKPSADYYNGLILLFELILSLCILWTALTLPWFEPLLLLFPPVWCVPPLIWLFWASGLIFYVLFWFFRAYLTKDLLSVDWWFSSLLVNPPVLPVDVWLLPRPPPIWNFALDSSRLYRV